MNFSFSDEQEELRRTIRRFCDQRAPSSEVRRLMETPEGFDETVWKQMAQELGLQGLALPEAVGGQGFGPIELGIVQEEFGRALAGGPFFASACLAAPAILAAATPEQQQRFLRPLAAGEQIATLAFAEANGRWDQSGIEASVAGGRISGTKSYVIDGHVAHLFVVAAREGNDIGLFAVRADDDGIERELLDTMDMTRKQARVTFNDVPAERLGTAGWEAIQTALDHGNVMLAAESTGGAQRCLDMAVDYAKNRVQFGRPIGQFQAVKHKCADMLLSLESARTAAYYAMWAAADGTDEFPIAASLSKAYCTEAYFKVSSDNIQVHGGIGFTWEHDAHLYYKRAKSSELLFGDPTFHRERIADLLGI